MKLYNKTKCPGSILKPLLIAAGKSVGARTTGVVVKVTQIRQSYREGSGVAYQQPLVYSWHLRNFKSRRGHIHRVPLGKVPLGKLIRTDGGWVEIRLPAKSTFENLDSLKRAAYFYEVAQHEWGHIRDYQQGVREVSPRTPSGRRVRHDDRIEEQRANAYVAEAKKLYGVDDLILDLAIWLEEE
jgi:hypothetical protein